MPFDVMGLLGKSARGVGRVAGFPFRKLGSFAFGFICDRCFEKVDIDKSGFLDAIEIELAILYLYTMVNKRLPGWEDPPTRLKIQEAIAAFDTDKNGRLDKKEFKEFVKGLTKSGPDALFSRLGKNMAGQAAILPGAAILAQKALPGFDKVPAHFLAPLLGTTYKSIRGLIPV